MFLINIADHVLSFSSVLNPLWHDDLFPGPGTWRQNQGKETLLSYISNYCFLKMENKKLIF